MNDFDFDFAAGTPGDAAQRRVVLRALSVLADHYRVALVPSDGPNDRRTR